MGILLFVLPCVCPFFFLSKFFFKDISTPFKIETSYLVYSSTTTSCIVGLQMGILLFVLPSVCSFFFLSKFFGKDIFTTVKNRNFIFGIQVYNHKLYRGIENGLSPICFFLLFVPFSFFPDFSSKISPQPFKIETSNLVWFTTTNCIVGFTMDLLLFVLPYVFFSYSPDFSSKISPQPFKIETSNVIYRFTTTSCIVGLKMGLLLFVLPYVCSFFFLSRFFVKDISTTV